MTLDSHEPSPPGKLVVAYQGAEGAYSQIATEKHFAARSDALVCRGYGSFREILQAVVDGAADHAMLPIENTTAGSINDAYDLLASMPLYVIGEEVLRVEHCLCALPGATLSQIKRVYSHPQALAQCAKFLESLTVSQACAVLAFTDTAMAVRKVRDEGDASQAAVASERAAKLYGLSILHREIMNQRDNFTRFMVVAREPVRYDLAIPCKTSLIFTTRHEQGALVRCLNILSEHGLNLTKIESRPRPGTPFEYLFYVDFEGNVADPRTQAAVDAVQSHTMLFKLLGSYPARTPATRNGAVG